MKRLKELLTAVSVAALSGEPNIPMIPRGNPKIHSENRKKCKSCEFFPCFESKEPLSTVCRSYKKKRRK